MRSAFTTLEQLLPPAAVLAFWRLRAAAGDRGDIGIVGTIWIAVGLAVLAGAVVLAIDSKTRAWIAQLPSP